MNNSFKLIVADRKSWILDEIIRTIEWKDYAILTPWFDGYMEEFDKNSVFRTDYTKIHPYFSLFEKAQCIIYVDGLPFAYYHSKDVHSDYMNFQRYIAEVYTPSLANLIRAESLGKRIVFISDHNSITNNALTDFLYYNVGSSRLETHEQISHPTIWVPYQSINEIYYKESKTNEDWDKIKTITNTFKNALGQIIDSFELEMIPVSASSYAKKNKLLDIALIYNPNNNFSNIEIASTVNNLYSAINFEPLHLNEHQNSSLIDYLKGSENGLAKLIESIIFCIPKLKEMKLQRIKTEKEIELLSEEIKAKKNDNEFIHNENTLKLVKEMFDVIDKADNETKILIANSLLIEKKIGNLIISKKAIKPNTKHYDM